jgi:hypothetical protein
MKRWAILTAAIYALALLLLTIPVVTICFANWGKHDDNMSLRKTLDIYTAWQYWIWLAVLVAGQCLLLLLPINIAEKRLPARRPLKMPVIVCAFLLANLFVAGVFSIYCAVFTDDALRFFSFTDWLLGHHLANQPGTVDTTIGGALTTVGITMGILWLIWAIVFSRYAKSDDPDALLKRITRWLLRGSILELLIAVPSHVIVRRRDDCCAPAGTFWGIATGISVMLLCFGPGVFYLFAERFQRLNPKDIETANMP